MLRPSLTAKIALSLIAAAGLTGCKTIYSDTYSSKRNYFKPEKEQARPTELLPESTPTLPDGGAPPMPMPAPAPAPPGLDGAAIEPAPGAAPAPAPPAIPGL